MIQYNQTESVPTSFNAQLLLQLLRVVGAVLGIVAIIIGLVYATRIFSLLFNALQNPEAFHAHLNVWKEAVGGDELTLVIAGETYPCAGIIASLLLGGGATVLAWISMGFITTGAKTLSWTLSDREAVKRVLVHAFGPTRRPEPNTTESPTK